MYINHEINYLEFLKQRKVILFGCGDLGVKCLERLRKLAVEVAAFADNNIDRQGTTVQGVRVIGIKELASLNEADGYFIVICSGRQREIREQLFGLNIFNVAAMDQIDFGWSGVEYYDDTYFSYQEEIGKFSAPLKKPMFEPHISPEDRLLDYGCGGGELLHLLTAGEKMGVEINDKAREAVAQKGITCFKYLAEVPDESIDTAISCSALEHVENPFGELRMLRQKLRPGGKAVFYVPNESCDTEYRRNDVNNHLYTWNCLNLGNLFKAAGYFVHSVERIQEVWPEHYLNIRREVSDEFFDTICKAGGRLYDENRCLIVAYK